MKLKICGMRQLENIKAVLSMQPDYLGFNFYPLSKRYVGEDFEIKHLAFGDTKKVGVFVNETKASILSIAKRYDLDYVQLHGNETIALCQEINSCYPVIKAIGIKERADLLLINNYAPAVTHILLDSKSAEYGGTGQSFDWNLLNEIKIPYLLSGGLNQQNTIELKQMGLEYLFGIDVNSGFEIEPALKDIVALQILKNNIQHD
jgi:phosphoribosylanthranilate isomerase